MAQTSTLPRTSGEQFELHALEAREVTIQPDTIGEEASPTNVQDLAPVDGGRKAWTMLLAAWVFEGMIWGFSMSFGVFQDYYSKLPQFGDSRYIAVIGTVATGVTYLGTPLIMHLTTRYHAYRKHMIYAGWTICMAGLAAGSFANTVSSLIATQGVMYGLGYVIMFAPIISIMNEWWVQRRGLAFGIICSATGLTGLGMPFIIQALLDRYGHQTTLRALTVALSVLTFPLMPLLNPRLPASDHSHQARLDLAFLRKPLFYIFNLSNMMHGFGYFFPSLYLPSYASAIGLSTTQGALLIALMCLAQTLGQFTFGFLSDRKVSVNILIILSTVVSAVSALTLWGLAHSLTLLILFALVYGFFGAGYVSIWARMGLKLTDTPSGALFIFSTLSFGKGLGNVLAGPISAGLLQQVLTTEYGIQRYKDVIIFTGSMMFASATLVGAWSAVGKVKRLV